MKRITYLILIGLALSLVLSAQSQSRIVELGSDAPSPSARVTSIDPGAGVIFFGWVGDDGGAVDSGTYVARFAPLDPDSETGEFATLTDAEIASAILAPEPQAAVPVKVTRRQLFLALLQVDETLTRDAIRTMLSTEAQRIELDEAADFERAHPMVAALAAHPSLNLTSDQVDDIFRAAATL